MKRNYFFVGVLGLVFTVSVSAWSQDSTDFLDARISSAVYMLSHYVDVPTEVSLYPIVIDGTEDTSELSGYLYNRIKYFLVKTDMFSLSPTSRNGTNNISKARIEGAYTDLGNRIEATINLFTAANKNIGTENIRMPKTALEALNIKWLPENRVSEKDAQQKNNELKSIAKNISNGSGILNIDAWPDSESYTYVDGETMQINILADRDCYFTAYYIDAEGKMQLIYPNPQSRNNFLKANIQRTIPDTTEYVMGAPFGTESIMIIACEQQIAYSESEMMPIQGSRGMSQILKKTAAATEINRDTAFVQARFNYTVVPQNIIEEKFSIKKLDDMALAVKDLKTTVESVGGTFSGNEQGGFFKTSDFVGSYNVVGDDINVVVRHNIETSFTDYIPSNTRGMSNNNFSFAKPNDISAALRKVRSAIETQGGTLIGDERTGEFKTKSPVVVGKYNVSDNVSVTISEKPAIAPISLVAKKVKEYFGVK